MAPGLAEEARRVNPEFANLANIFAPGLWARHSLLFSTTWALVRIVPSSLMMNPVAEQSSLCPCAPGPTATSCTTAEGTEAGLDCELGLIEFWATESSAQAATKNKMQMAPRRKEIMGRVYSSQSTVNSLKSGKKGGSRYAPEHILAPHRKKNRWVSKTLSSRKERQFTPRNCNSSDWRAFAPQRLGERTFIFSAFHREPFVIGYSSKRRVRLMKHLLCRSGLIPVRNRRKIDQ